MNEKKYKAQASTGDVTGPDETPDAGDAAVATQEADTEVEDTEDRADSESAEAENDLELIDTAVDPVAALSDELATAKERLLRALAETENVRRRAAKDREDAAKYAITAFARDLLPAADNLRRALESLPEDAHENEALAGFVSGVELTERELVSALDRHGIRRLDPLGEKFDHNYHQAIFEVPDSDAPSGTVVQVVQAGYVIADRLLRPAMVGVAKNSDTEAPSAVDTKA